MELNDCQDLTLDNIVRVDVIERVALGIPLPPNVPMLSQLALGTTHPLIAFSAGFSKPVGDEGKLVDHFTELEESSSKVSFKTTKAASIVGHVYSYDIQISGVIGIESGILPATQAERDVQGRDFSVVLRFMDGSSKLCYFLDGSSSLSVEQNSSADLVQATIKIGGKSMSNWITLTN